MNKAMYIIKNLLTLTLLLGTVLVIGQTKSLKVGDRYDYKEYVKVLNAQKTEISLKDYDDRLLILDFFTTSCGSCIRAMPKNNRLQLQFDSLIHILPVTVEKEEYVRNFFAKNPTVKDNLLPIGYADVSLKEVFPYEGVPHVVWVYKGKVKAITNADMLTKHYIDEMLAGKDISHWPQKNDFYSFNKDTSKPLGTYFISSVILPYDNGAKLSYFIDTLTSELIRDRWVNVPIVTAYIYAFSMIDDLPLMKKERIALEVDEPYSFERPDSVVQSIWEQKHSIGYESILSIHLSNEERMKRIIADLNTKLGLYARLEYRPAQVWVVAKGKPKSKIDKIQKGRQSLGLKMGLLEVMYPEVPPIVLDGVDELMEVSIKGSDDFEILKNQLLENGLSLKKANRLIQKLVITEL